MKLFKVPFYVILVILLVLTNILTLLYFKYQLTNNQTKSTALLSSNKNTTGLNENNNVLSAVDLYKDLIISNNINNVKKEEFIEFVGFFNNYKFNKNEYYFFNGDYSIDKNGKYKKKKYLVYPIDKTKIVDIFRLFTGGKIKYQPNNEFSLDNVDLSKGNYIFYNKHNNYFFTYNNFNVSNYLCRKIIYSNEDSISIFLDYQKENHDKLFIPLKDVKKLFSGKKINSRILIYKGLYTLAYYYNKTKDKSYRNDFIKLFNNQLNIYYSIPEFTAFFSIMKKDLKEKDGFCNKFSDNYFGF